MLEDQMGGVAAKVSLNSLGPLLGLMYTQTRLTAGSRKTQNAAQLCSVFTAILRRAVKVFLS